MSESWAAVLAAMIGVIGTLLATRFDELANLLRRPTRKISGEWQSCVKTIDVGVGGHPPFEIEYNLIAKQTGNRVRATMVETKISEGYKPYTYIWEGFIRNDYFTFQVYSKNPEQFIAMSGNLYIGPTGKTMRGYIAGNAGAKSPARVWVGYAEMERKV